MIRGYIALIKVRVNRNYLSKDSDIKGCPSKRHDSHIQNIEIHLHNFTWNSWHQPFLIPAENLNQNMLLRNSCLNFRTVRSSSTVVRWWILPCCCSCIHGASPLLFFLENLNSFLQSFHIVYPIFKKRSLIQLQILITWIFIWLNMQDPCRGLKKNPTFLRPGTTLERLMKSWVRFSLRFLSATTWSWACNGVLEAAGILLWLVPFEEWGRYSSLLLEDEKFMVSRLEMWSKSDEFVLSKEINFGAAAAVEADEEFQLTGGLLFLNSGGDVLPPLSETEIWGLMLLSV